MVFPVEDVDTNAGRAVKDGGHLEKTRGVHIDREQERETTLSLDVMANKGNLERRSALT